MRLPSLLLALSLLAGCAEYTQTAQVEATDAVQDAVAEVSEAIDATSKDVATISADVTTPAVLAAREAVEAAAPAPVSTPVDADPAAVALVVRWEVGSPAQYTRKYQGVICPGGASGPTIGIGYDLGTQTAASIRAAWGWHPQVDLLVTASGQTGPQACTAWKKAHTGIRVTYDDALRVFTEHDWPAYLRMAERAYRNGWKALSLRHQGGLGSNGYNRGFSMVGSRNAEKRHTRDVCVPNNDADCTAADLIASCRIWDSQPAIRKGLCARRHDEARFVRS